MIYKNENHQKIIEWLNEIDRRNSDYYSDFKESIEIVNLFI
jgi:hypothetical protein